MILLNRQELELLHKHSISNEIELMSSNLCGCFYCNRLFKPNRVKEFVTEKDGTRTAHCPYCGIDSVIGDFAYRNLDSKVLKEMHKEFFDKMVK